MATWGWCMAGAMATTAGATAMLGTVGIVGMVDMVEGTIDKGMGICTGVDIGMTYCGSGIPGMDIAGTDIGGIEGIADIVGIAGTMVAMVGCCC